MATETEQKPSLPPKPTVSYMETPDVAIAQAVTKLTDPSANANDRSIQMLSALREDDVARLALLITIGEDQKVGCPWLKDYAHTELRLACSVMQKRGGIRSEQVVEVAKQPPMMADGGGFFGGIKRRFGGGGMR